MEGEGDGDKVLVEDGLCGWIWGGEGGRLWAMGVVVVLAGGMGVRVFVVGHEESERVPRSGDRGERDRGKGALVSGMQ